MNVGGEWISSMHCRVRLVRCFSFQQQGSKFTIWSFSKHSWLACKQANYVLTVLFTLLRNNRFYTIDFYFITDKDSKKGKGCYHVTQKQQEDRDEFKTERGICLASQWFVVPLVHHWINRRVEVWLPLKGSFCQQEQASHKSGEGGGEAGDSFAHSVRSKLRNLGYKLGEFCEIILSHWPV